jgi:hypothetical protein
MWRFPLPVFFALIAALTVPVAEGLGDDAAPRNALRAPSASPFPTQGPPAPGGAEQQGERNRAADLRRQVSDLQGLIAQVRQQIADRKARKPPTGNHETRDAPEQKTADLQRQDSELHGQLTSLIAQLEQELQIELQSPPVSDTAEQQDRQAAREAFKHAIADLRQEKGELRDLIAGHEQAVDQNETQPPPAPTLREDQAGQGSLEHQAADMQNRIAELQRQNDALQRQLAEQKTELAQSAQKMAQRTHDLATAQAEAERLRYSLETVRQQRNAEAAPLARQKAPPRQMAVVAPAQPAAPQRTPRATQPMPIPQPPPTRQPPALAQQPEQPITMPPSVTQQLQTARQWLSVGRPDMARRVLATVQTQMVFQPVTPDQPIAQSHNPSATDVGDAIRWLDMGADEQAMWSITRAIESSAGGGGLARAWSGYSAGSP